MREIKFRAWDTYKMKMLKDYDWEWCAISKEGILVEPGYTSLEESSKNVELMQYVGVKDKNQKEIYEGDIVIFETLDAKNNKTLKGTIIYDRNGFVVDVKGYGYTKFYDPYIEIIGNIYENPELIN